MMSVAVGGYLVIGVLVSLSPLGRAEIEKQVQQVRGDPLANAITGRKALPEWKAVVFRVVLTLAVVLLWPMLVVSWMQDRSRTRKEQKAWEARIAQGLEYDRMGGVGEICCEACGFLQEITSFTHGFSDGPEASADEGRQCLQCGKFTTVHLQGNPPVKAIPRCECGGELSREHVLFCPKCRSTRLQYGMAYIT